MRRFLKKMKKKPTEKLTMVTLGGLARKGNRRALNAIKEEGHLLGIWLGSMINVLDPEIIVIGGGVSSLGKILFDPMKEAILTHTININAAKTPVVAAKLKKDVGILGSASVLMKTTSQ